MKTLLHQIVRWENLETSIIQLIIDNITLDENLRKQISQTIAKKM